MIVEEQRLIYSSAYASLHGNVDFFKEFEKEKNAGTRKTYAFFTLELALLW